ncbi:MAG: RluA family pseudouridine synthase [Hyphomicrobium sp.]
MTIDPMARICDVTITGEDAGQRLDRVLAARIPELSRSRLKALIQSGQVTSGGATLGDPGRAVKPGETISVRVPEAAPAEPQGEAIPLAVVFEDQHLIVIDKPAGLVVHPAAGHAGGTLVNALIAHCGESLSGIGGVKRPGIVHRLDKETSGLLVVAKSDTAHQGLAAQFAAHGSDGRLERAYRAIVWGAPAQAQGRIEAPIGRHPTQRTRMAVVKLAAGRHAATRYQVEEHFRDPDGGTVVASRLRMDLETGRTHQIRVHLAHIGHPVLGDPVYGQSFKASARRLDAQAQSALADLGRQALHAAELGFEHPLTRQRLRFSSPLPDAMARLDRALARGRAGKITTKIDTKSRRR